MEAKNLGLLAEMLQTERDELESSGAPRRRIVAKELQKRAVEESRQIALKKLEAL